MVIIRINYEERDWNVSLINWCIKKGYLSQILSSSRILIQILGNNERIWSSSK